MLKRLPVAPSSRDAAALPRRLLLASVSALALGVASPLPAAAQSPVFARRSAAADPAAAVARAAQSQAVEQARAAEYAANALAVFARAQQTRASLDQLQAQARAAAALSAAPAGVANGLAPGGLVPQLAPETWRGAAAPVQAEAGGRTAVTVRQTESRAILTWQSFNVGRETDLRFDQSAGGTRAREWAVLNRVEDVTAQPSRILGSIEAQGQVYIINRNGVIFGGTSQVNVGTLIAGALDLGGWDADTATRNARFRAGLLVPPANAGNYAPTLTLDRPALLRDGTGAPRRIAVDVEPGARITLREEGSAILAAPVVTNAGSIVAPSGQVILSAGAGLRLDTPGSGPFAPRIGLEAEALRRGPGSDSLLLDPVAGTTTQPYPFEARNAGLISAPRGNVTLTGLRVINDAGAVISATTANNRPGSVLLTARDVGGTENVAGATDPTRANAYRFGEVVLAPRSLVEITAEPGADQVVFNTATSPFEQSRLAITGATVRLQEGSVIRAPAASLRIAGDLPSRVFTANAQSGGRLQAVVLERDSVIDLGGLKDLTAPVARNLIEVQTFRGELADAPLQREGFLYDFAQRRGRVVIDTRIGSQIVNWQPTAAGVGVSVAERMGTGGRLEIAAERVFALEGSRIDVSGGLLTWQGGMRPATTRLLGADGRIYDIGNARGDLAFVGLPGELTATQARWGVTETFRSPLLATRPIFETGYVEGFDGGAVTIRGRFYGDGIVEGAAFTGQRQQATSRANDGDAQTTPDLPRGGALSFLGFRPLDSVGNALIRSEGIGGLINPSIVEAVEQPLGADFAARLRTDPTSTRDIRLRHDTGPAAPATTRFDLPADRRDTLLSVRDVLGRGWSSIAIEADGRLAMVAPGPGRAAPDLVLPAGGSLSVNAWSVEIQGRILAPGGSIALTANAGSRIAALRETLDDRPLFPVPIARPVADADGVMRDGRIILGEGAVLSTRGRWVNDALGLAEGLPSAGRAFLDGGNIALTTRFTPYPRGQAPTIPQGAVVDPLAVPVEGRDILVAAGALLDVSGGGALSGAGALTGGRGGTLSLGTYAAQAASPTGAPLAVNALGAGSVGFVITGRFARSVIEDGAALQGTGTGRVSGGAANARGGVLALAAPAIALGRAATPADEAAGILVPDLDRFASAGFSEFRLTAPIAGRAPFQGLPAGSIAIAPGAVIAPVAASRLLRDDTARMPGVDPRLAPSDPLDNPLGATPREAWSQIAVPVQADRAPMRIILAAGGTLDAGDAATVLRADPGGPRNDGSAALISLSGARPILLRGTLEAPAGSIRVSGTGDLTVYGVEQGLVQEREIRGTEFLPGQALWVASTARLLARGLADRIPQERGLVAGAVRPGGSIDLQENRGWLVLESGAVLDVSGAAGETDSLAPVAAPGRSRVSTLALASDAGSITLRGARGAFIDGTMLGQAGGPGARGATLTLLAPSPLLLNAGDFVTPTPTISLPANLPGPSGIVLRAAGPTLPAGTRFGDALDPSLRRIGPIDWTGGERTDRAFLAASALAESGIDRLYLAAPSTNVIFDGSVALTVPRAVQIESQRILVTGTAPAASITTGYLLLNGSNISPATPTLRAIPGSRLDLVADWIDVLGGVTLFGAERNSLAARGDLRLIGTAPDAQDTEFGRVIGRLTSQGDLVLRAAQVYPASATAFTVTAAGIAAEPPRTLRIEASGAAAEAPLSAGAVLTLSAGRIEQAGVLRVPQGRLVLSARQAVDFLPGSLTSVSGEGRIVPLGQLVSNQGPLGLEIYPSLLGPGGIQTDGLAAPPEKTILVTAPEIRAAAGATIDVSGGAELLAWRFVAGPGGSRDVLARSATPGTTTPTTYQYADRRDVFAILPTGPQPAAAPYSPTLVDSGTSLGRGDVTVEAPSAGRNDYGQQIAGLLPTVGEQIRIGTGVPGLPAGTYTLLPARYALLPGAFRVVMAPLSQTPRIETPLAGAVARADGSWILPATRVVAGTGAGAGLAEARQRQIEVAPAESWSRYSTLQVRTASDFFAERSARLEDPVPRLPADAGRLTLLATQALVLEGTTRFAIGPGGRGGQAEISADRIAVTPGGVAYATPGYLPISDVALSNLGAETLTIGGLRSTEPTGERLDPRARAVVLAEGARLSGPEVVLTARAPASGGTADDSVRLEAGASLEARGAVTGAPTPLLLGRVAAGTLAAISGDGAVLRVSAGGRTEVLRDNLPGSGGTGIVLGAGARVAGAAVLLDALGPTRIAPDVRFAAGALDLVGNAIVLGAAPPSATAMALALSPEVLDGLLGNGALPAIGEPRFAGLSAIQIYDELVAINDELVERFGIDALRGIGALRLVSRSGIDLYGPVILAGRSVTLDAAALRGFAVETPAGGRAEATLAIVADRVALRNGLGGAVPAVTEGAGGIAIRARSELRVGGGSMVVSGFGATAITADSQVTFAGIGGLGLPGDVTVTAPLVTAVAGTDMTLTTGGSLGLTLSAAERLRLAEGGAPRQPLDGEALGARLSLESGTTLSVATRLLLPAGTLSLTALTGDLGVGSDAILDVGGRARGFFDLTRIADAGSLSLTAGRGSIGLDAGAMLNVAAARPAVAGGGEAGRLVLTAQAGAVAIGATLLGQGGSDAVGGRIAIDAGGAVDLAALGPALDQGGFFGERRVHTRSGDLALPAGSVLRAREIALTADSGQVAIGGVLDASGPRGGLVALYGRDGVTLQPGAAILATAADPGRPGGQVEIGAGPTGRLQLDGGFVAVGGNDPLRGSTVRLRVPADRALTSGYGLAVSGARVMEVEPYRVAGDGVVTATAIRTLFEQTAPAALRPAAAGAPGIPQPWRIVPGVEIGTAASMTLGAGTTIDLRPLRTAEGEPGVLTLRADGDLTILSSISDGFTSADLAATQIAGRSWSLRLVAGADRASADPLATRDAALAGTAGSVLIGAPWTYRAGTENPATLPITVRTGTGGIDIAAARDVLLRDPDATVYTAGRPVADRNLVTGLTADGQAATGYFYDPAAPTYGLVNPAAPDIPGGDPSVANATLTYPAAYPVEGGNLRIVAGRDIRATVLDGAGGNAGQTASAWLWRQGAVEADTGLFIYRPAITTPWRDFASTRNQLPVGERSTQTSWWVNFSTFQQNFGVLGGGDAALRAGRDFQGSVSVPTTSRVGGGLAPTYDTIWRPAGRGDPIGAAGATPRGTGPAVQSIDGGGDLALSVGRDIGAASQFLLGRGEGRIRAGGALQAATIGTVRPSFGALPTTALVGSVFALGDARLDVAAGGGVAATIYDPLQAPAGRLQQVSDAWTYAGSTAVGSFSGYRATSSMTLSALGGDALLLGAAGSNPPLGPLTALRSAPRARTAGTNGTLLYREFINEGVLSFTAGFNATGDGGGGQVVPPPNLALTAFDGDIGFQRTGNATAGATISLRPDPGPTGSLTLVAGGSILRPTIFFADASAATLRTPLHPFYDAAVFDAPGARTSIDARPIFSAATPQAPLTESISAGNPDRTLLYARGGDIERPRINTGAGDVAAMRVGLRAGRDITDLDIVLQHAQAGDISFVQAGRDIGSLPDPTLTGAIFGNALEVRGPGRLQLIAGRDIAQILPSGTGVRATRGIRSTGNAANLLFPEGSAGIDVLFGVSPGNAIDAAGFLARYLDPDRAPTIYRVEMEETGGGRATWRVQSGAGAPTDDATLGRIRGLGTPEKLALAIDLYFRELDASGQAAAAATAAGQTPSYERGNQAIAALFPPDPTRPAPAPFAGNLNLQNSFIRTEQGGAINVLGPGGDFFLGAISTTGDRFPDRVGVLTLGYGPIRIFTHGDIQVGQSRVITVDGGDIFMWSATADINAGLGSRTARFVPPFRVSYLEDGTRLPDRAGLITGSGIATYTPFTAPAAVPALQVTPGSEVEAFAQAEEARQRSTPSISLVAPIGAVDFGDAGVRSAGNLSVAAQTVLNASNANVGGASIGVPTVAAPNVGAAVAAAAAAGSATNAATDAARQATRQDARPQEPASTIVVEILGFGGSEAEAAGTR